MNIKKPNRKNKRKCKGGCGCKMCKPYKGKYAHQFEKKLRSKMQDMDSEFVDIVNDNFFDLLSDDT